MHRSRNPHKAAVEHAWMLYTPLWGAGTAMLMLTRWADTMGDADLLIFGGLVALGAFVMPYVFAAMGLVRGPIHTPTLTAMYASVVVLSFGLNYFQTPFFFDVLHMRYGFKATWRIDRNPVFLYLVTVAYFATYATLANFSARVVLRKWNTTFGRVVTFTVVPLALAFLETILNANPWTERVFCYNDMPFALSFGSVCYGVAFFYMMPVWLDFGGIAETAASSGKPKLARAVFRTAVAVALDTATLAVIRAFVAPYFTTVVDNAAPGGGCLKP